VVIGYEGTEQLDVEPLKYIERVTKRENRACACCPEQRVACALLPIIEKNLASNQTFVLECGCRGGLLRRGEWPDSEDHAARTMRNREKQQRKMKMSMGRRY
jgi:hypothetical protein